MELYRYLNLDIFGKLHNLINTLNRMLIIKSINIHKFMNKLSLNFKIGFITFLLIVNHAIKLFKTYFK